MTAQIALVLGILLVSLVLFVTEWLRMDLVALLVLASLAVTGLVTPAEALAGFSNPAVVTVWAMFMLSGALTQAGVAAVIGRHVLRLVGRGEARMIAVIMLASAGLSAFMNNIGVAALLLPVVMDIARQTGRAPSRLLMPLAYGSLLGGLTTLIGTPPNLLVSEALREGGLQPFRLFDFTPVGSVVMFGGIAFVALAGRHLLPLRDIGRESAAAERLALPEQYALQERTAVLRLRPGSPLDGRTLGETRLGSAAGLNVLAIIRAGRTRPAPDPDATLQAGDLLLVGGRLDRFEELRGWSELLVEEQDLGLEALAAGDVELRELVVAPASELVGQTLGQSGFRRRFGAIVLAVRRGTQILQTGLADTALTAGDRLLVQGSAPRLAVLAGSADFSASTKRTQDELSRLYRLEHRIFSVRLPGDSVLVGKSLAQSRLGDALGLGVLGVVREGQTRPMPDPDEMLLAGDRLLVRGSPEDLRVFRGLQQLEIESEAPRRLDVLETERAGMFEVILAPRSTLVGQTLRDVEFRKRYGLRVLAVLREGRAIRSNLRDVRLRFGDALLLFGQRDRLALLAQGPDFLVLTRTDQPVPRRGKAPLAALIMIGVLVPVLLGWLPIAVAAVTGAALMILTRCLGMEDAYRCVEWRSIFLIAGMLPLGAALQQTGAAAFLADGVLALSGSSPWAALVSLYLVTAVATMIIPTAALVVLMAPIVLKTSTDLGISPHAVMMAVAVAASASFTSPISHPANVLVMGPGGYRFVDYLKLGVPLTLVVLVVALVALPFFWPLHP